MNTPTIFSCTIVGIIVSTLKSWSHLEWIFGNEEWDRNPVEDFLRWLASCSCAICQTHPLPFIFILFPVLEGPRGSMESPEQSPRKYHVDFPQVCQRPTRRSSPGLVMRAGLSVIRTEEQVNSQKVPRKGHHCSARHDGTIVFLSWATRGHASNVFLLKEKEKEKPQGRVYSLHKEEAEPCLYFWRHTHTLIHTLCTSIPHTRVYTHMHLQVHIQPDTRARTRSHTLTLNTPDTLSFSSRSTRT